jgi:hypothetical protein
MKKKVRAYRNSHPPVRYSAVCRVRESVREDDVAILRISRNNDCRENNVNYQTRQII